MATRKTNSTRIAAEVFSAKARSGLSAHKNTCTGRTLAGSFRLPGTSAMKATMPIISNGAVSPSARAMPMIEPVRMPGIASGRTWWNTACMGEAPTASAPSLIEGGTAPMATRAVMMMVGSVIRASVRPPTIGAERGQVQDIEEQRQAEQSEHDRGHGGEVVDVDLDEVGPAVLGGEGLEIDGGEDTERESKRQRHGKGQDRPDYRAQDAGELGLTRIATAEEPRVEARAHLTRAGQGVDPGEIAVLEPPFGFGAVALDPALAHHVDIVRGRQPQCPPLAYEARIVEHKRAQAMARAHAHQADQGAHVRPGLDLGETGLEGATHHRGVIAARESRRLGFALGIDQAGIEEHLEPDLGGQEDRVSLDRNGGE